jgi:phage tail-like protein
MAGETQNNIWPLPKFSFSISVNGTAYPCQEVTGLDAETQVIEYRHSNSKTYSTIKMPGLAKYGNVTVKKGIFVNDKQFWTWFSATNMNTYKRLSVVISLLDEKGKPTMSWTLINAWPSKIQGTDLKSDSNEVAVESIEFAHEGLTVKNPN